MAQARSGDPARGGSNPVGQGFVSLGGGASVVAGEMPLAEPLSLEKWDEKDWARLPKKLAHDLLEGSRENVSPEYREAVETYFRVIAERARMKRGG
jgi:hypothetical protein